MLTKYIFIQSRQPLNITYFESIRILDPLAFMHRFYYTFVTDYQKLLIRQLPGTYMLNLLPFIM